MKTLSMMFVLVLIFSSCNKEEETKIKYSTTLSGKPETSNQAVSTDDFSDFEKKDEECTDEEDLEKKIQEMKKPAKLQGGSDEDCTVQ